MDNTFEPPKKVGTTDVNAYCPVCQSRSNFLYKTSDGREYGWNDFASQELKNDRNFHGRFIFRLLICSTCGLAGLGEFHNEILYKFHPSVEQHAQIPEATPASVSRELRSSENCAGIEEYRPAAAMLRSTVEKILKEHGYIDELEWSLKDKLDTLGKDNILPRYLVKQNSEIVKILGDEILHGEWREIAPDEYRKAHHYTIRLIEAFYDDHDTVIEVLKELKRLNEKGKPISDVNETAK